MTQILFGPAGNSDAFTQAGFRATADAPAWIARMGLTAYEYQCGRGVRVGTETAQRIGQAAREHGIALSLHAPYFINLSTDEAEQQEKNCLLYTSPSPRDRTRSRMPSSA